jgi:hypothetical protein
MSASSVYDYHEVTKSLERKFRPFQITLTIHMFPCGWEFLLHQQTYFVHFYTVLSDLSSWPICQFPTTRRPLNTCILVARYLRPSLTVTNTWPVSPGTRREGKRQRIRCLALNCHFNLPFPSYSDADKARKYFASIIHKKQCCARN